jgi:hypothetical protein
MKLLLTMILVTASVGARPVNAQTNRTLFPNRTPERASVIRKDVIIAARKIASTPEMKAAVLVAKTMWLHAAGRPPQTRSEEAMLQKDLKARAYYVALVSLNSDPLHPKITQFGWRATRACGMEIPATGMTVNNQDNVYYHIPIDGSSTYVIRSMPTTKEPIDFSFKLAVGWPNMVTVDTLAGDAVVKNNDGSFDLVIAANHSDNAINVLKSNRSQQHSLMIRETLGNWTSEIPHRYSVVRVLDDRHSAELKVTEKYRPEQLYLKYISDMTSIMKRFSKYPNNQFGIPFNSAIGGGLAVQLNAEGKFDLSGDKAMVVTVKPGNARYFNIQVLDPWLSDIETDTQIGELNNMQSNLDTNGIYTYVISAKDPGIHNWLNTSGMKRGFIYSRFQKFPGIEPSNQADVGFPKITTRVVKFAEVAKLVLDQRVSRTGRSEQLRARAMGYNKRMECD